MTFEELQAAMEVSPNTWVTRAALRDRCIEFADALHANRVDTDVELLSVRLARQGPSVDNGTGIEDGVLVVKARSNLDFVTTNLEAEMYIDRLTNGLPKVGRDIKPLQVAPPDGSRHSVLPDGAQHSVASEQSLRFVVRCDFIVESNASSLQRVLCDKMAVTTQFLMVTVCTWLSQGSRLGRQFAAVHDFNMDVPGTRSYELHVCARFRDEPVDMAATYSLVHVGLETVRTLLQLVTHNVADRSTSSAL
jgi:hypothetical protein